MKLVVELTRKGENSSASGRTCPFIGYVTYAEVPTGQVEWSKIKVRWEDGTYGTYYPDDHRVAIIGFSNC